MNHLGEVAGADVTGVDEAGVTLRLQRVEERLNERDVFVAAAGHQRVAVFQAPDAAGDAAVDETDCPCWTSSRGVALVVGVLRITAVDHHVTGDEQLAELVDGLLRGCARPAPSPTRRAGSAARQPALAGRRRRGRPGARS